MATVQTTSFERAAAPEGSQTPIASAKPGRLRAFARMLGSNRKAAIGVGLLAIFGLIAVIGPWIAPDDPNLVERLNKKGVKITARPPEEDVPSILGVLVNWFPMLLLIGVWVFFMRQMQSGGGRAMGFGKSKAKLESLARYDSARS